MLYSELSHAFIELTTAVSAPLTVNANHRTIPVPTRRTEDQPARFKEPVAPKLGIVASEPKHRSTQKNGSDQRGSYDVLDHPGYASGSQTPTHLRHEIGMRKRVVHRLHGRMRLARWRGVNSVKPIERKPQRIGLDELEWIPRLRPDVYAYHVESRAVVAHRSPACTREKVEQPWPSPHCELSASVSRGSLCCGVDAIRSDTASSNSHPTMLSNSSRLMRGLGSSFMAHLQQHNPIYHTTNRLLESTTESDFATDERGCD